MAEIDPFRSAIAGVRAPDSKLAREAANLARNASGALLFNHVMRSYYFGRLLSGSSAREDEEVVFLSAVLHDLGLTDHARGERRFEIEGADAARGFVSSHGLSAERAWLVWDTIALHTTTDLNMYKEPEAVVVQRGIIADVVGAGIDGVERDAVEEILAAFPRYGFKRGFLELLRNEVATKPPSHPWHPVTMVQHHCCGGVQIADVRPMIEGAPFDD